MKILLITPIYYIEGRPDLFHDTNCVHYFTKYWTNENQVCVLNIYPHTYRDLLKYKSREAKKYYKEGYRFEKDGVKVQLIEVQKFPGQNGHYLPFQCRHILKQTKKFLQDNNFEPDIVIAHEPSYAESFISDIVKLLKKPVPVIGVLHFTDIEDLKSRKDLASMFEKKFTAVYTRSHGIRRLAREFGISNLQDDIIQSGIPLDVGEGIHAPYKINDGLNILYVGKLIKRKNVDKILTAIRDCEYKDISFHVVGKGPEEEKLKKLVNVYGLKNRVKFYGTISREQVIKKMGEMNIFCMPSENETLGLTYIEAMSVGCVPIGTESEGIDGVIIDSQNGFLVKKTSIVDNLQSIFIQYCAYTDSQRKMLSDNAYNTAKGLDEEKCAEDYLKIVKHYVE